MQPLVVRVTGWFYRNIGTKIFFRFDSDPAHHFVLDMGQIMGAVPGVPRLVRGLYRIERENLKTTVAGIDFAVPIGLSAGFDHEGQLVRVVGSLGFGFESVGTVTNKPYGGNPKPQMKRLVKSEAILVNKGFKSSGMDAFLARMRGVRFQVPTGLSVGRTNTVDIDTHEEAIADICDAFRKAQSSNVPFSYYELNISCPNLLKDISFYIPERLDQLLSAVEALELGKPLFVKMPISLDDAAVRALIDVLLRHRVSALTFGNLQRDRKDPAFDAEEIKTMEGYKGHWAGKPTRVRSDELVGLAYRHTGGKLPIVGCGGVFTAEDAYRKIRLGASLVQLAAGTVFRGPQIAAEISLGLSRLLERDGFAHLADAVGKDA